MDTNFPQLNDLSREELVTWLRQVLLGEISLPQTSADQEIRSVLADAEAGMPAKTRRDLEFAIIALIKDLRTGPQRAIHYVENLVGLAADLKLIDAVPQLVGLAKSFAGGKAKLAHAAHTAVLFAIIDLRVPQPKSFWMEMWDHNQRDSSSSVLAAMLDRNAIEAIGLLPKLGNSEDLADAAILQLDYHADLMGVPDRRNFLNAVANVADSCKHFLKTAIREWMNEIGDEKPELSTKSTVSVRNILLFEALGEKACQPSSARLCSAY